jgi:hypothetical protein
MSTAFRLGSNVLRQFHSPWSIMARTSPLPKFRPMTRNYATPIIKYRPPVEEINVYRRFQHNQKSPFYKSKRVWVFVGTGTVIFGGYYITHLERVPISGRARFMDITPRQEEGRFIFDEAK